MSGVFLETFERHGGGEGLKGQTTHYCPGCGHGLAHKYLAEAIEAMGIGDRTVTVSPVGCAVFLYYYLDLGNTAAAHGRASAVAIGQKLANPESIVVSYQGDGDLAAIGIGEALQAAQIGLPMTVIFINNAVFGMTGGQMAPTTLAGQKTTTSPAGRDRLMGQPLKMAEMIASLEGSVYVERVALYDAKQRVRAAKAIRRALEVQVDRRGYSFVEVLSECPIHWGMTPEEAERWVRDKMVPVFPLGVKKNATVEPWPVSPEPCFDPGRVLEVVTAGGASVAVASGGEGAALGAAGDGLALKFAGAGGDGAQTAAMLIARAGIQQGLDATHIPSYGPESRGGTSYADVRIARKEVLSPAVPAPDILVAFNRPSLAKFGPQVVPGGTIIYDRSVVTDLPELPAGVRAVGVPCTEIATALGRTLVKNIVAIGALQAATGLFSKDILLETIREALQAKCALIPLNEEAFARGAAFVERG